MEGNILDRFSPPGHYVKLWSNEDRKFKYFLLTSREGPIKYPYTFEDSVAKGAKNTTKNFEDLNPKKNHIVQVLLGLRSGYQLYLWQPYDKKVLKMDEATLDDISEDSVALEYNDSPYENPAFSFWFTRDSYPGIQIKNITGKTIYPQIIFYICKFEYVEITRESNTELFDKLERNIVPSKPIFTGGIA